MSSPPLNPLPLSHEHLVKGVQKQFPSVVEAPCSIGVVIASMRR
jgi:hypothetical protein